jgi:hypothetical protein
VEVGVSTSSAGRQAIFEVRVIRMAELLVHLAVS